MKPNIEDIGPKIDRAIQEDPLSRICKRCESTFSPHFGYQKVTDSGRTAIHVIGNMLIYLNREERRLFMLFSKYVYIGLLSEEKESPPGSTQFIDGCWYWGDVLHERHCSTWCAKKDGAWPP